MLVLAQRESRERQRRRKELGEVDEDEVEESNNKIKALNIVHLQAPLMLLLIGLMIGSLVFVLEVTLFAK